MSRIKRGHHTSRLWLIPCAVFMLSACVCSVIAVATPNWIEVDCEVPVFVGVFRICNASYCDVTLSGCFIPGWWRCAEIFSVIGVSAVVSTTIITALVALAPAVAKDNVPMSLAALSFCSGCFLVMALFPLSGNIQRPTLGGLRETASSIYHLQCSSNTSTSDFQQSKSDYSHHLPLPMYLCAVSSSLCFLCGVIQLSVSMCVHANLSEVEETDPPSGRGRMFPVSHGKGIELEQGAAYEGNFDTAKLQNGRFTTKMMYNSKDKL